MVNLVKRARRRRLAQEAQRREGSRSAHQMDPVDLSRPGTDQDGEEVPEILFVPRLEMEEEPPPVAGNKTFLHGVRVVGPGPPRPAGIGPALSTPYQPTRDHDLENTSTTAQPPTPSTPLTVPDTEIRLRRPPQEIRQGYRPAAPIQHFNNKSLNWPAWFRHFRAVADVHGWSKDLRALQLVSYLDETVMDVAQELGDNELYNYDVLVKLLSNRFDPASRVSSSSLSGAGGSSGVGPTAGLFTIVLGGTAGQRTRDGGGYQPTTGRRCYVVESTDTVPICYGNEQDVIFHDGLGPRSIVVSESRAARAASYMSAMGLWHPQTNPGVPGPVSVSSCHSCMSCKYCFPEDQLPPGWPLKLLGLVLLAY